jgi:hypothetical protein
MRRTKTLSLKFPKNIIQKLGKFHQLDDSSKKSKKTKNLDFKEEKPNPSQTYQRNIPQYRSKSPTTYQKNLNQSIP